MTVRGRGSSARVRTLGAAVALSLLATATGPSVTGSFAAPAAADPLAEVVAPTAVTVDDPLRRLQWNLDRVNVGEAWALTRGVPEVTIAVIDTGVDDGHRDLERAFWRHPTTGAFGFNHLDGSFDTFTTREQDWHGTAVAGVAAARADDGYGIAGVAPGVKVMVHRVYASTGYGVPPSQTSYTGAIRAIRDATAAGADVILLSWGGTTPSTELTRAIRDAGVPVVAAAGNDGQDLSGSPTVERWPAMNRLPNLVTVAASDRSDRLLASSNHGIRHVDIAAPGEAIVSLSAGGTHDVFEGTSFAAPHVAGALALGRSLAPEISTTQLVASLVSTARRNPHLADKVTAGGVLDVATFLRAVGRPACGGEIPETSFSDLTRESTHIESIDCVVYHRIALGVDADRFAPRRTMTRGEMATFLARTLESAGYDISSAPPSGFVDVAGTTHERSIDVVAAAGIAKGTGRGRFEPTRPVTRGQMATFVVATVELLLGAQLEPGRDWFDDVAGTTHERSILQARELEITFGTGDPRVYAPSRDMSREQMASFIARTLDALGRRGVEVRPRT